MKAAMHNYERANFNLSRKVTTTMNVGTLIPTYVNIGLTGDKFEINIDSLIKTIPTIAPLFGSFKFQTDVFVCPIKNYQALLHNNPLNIGMRMKDVLFPRVYLTQTGPLNEPMKPFAYNSLLKYLGLSGLPTGDKIQTTSAFTSMKTYNALPILAYYDIFKNYYANKQEENAYVIGNERIYKLNVNVKYLLYNNSENEWFLNEYNSEDSEPNTDDMTIQTGETYQKISQIRIETKNKNWKDFTINIKNNTYTLKELENNVNQFGTDGENTLIVINNIMGQFNIDPEEDWEININFPYDKKDNYTLIDFPLENIDKMRYNILSENTIGTYFSIDTGLLKPYILFTDGKSDAFNDFSNFEQAGICVKTYQSDIFNNWINTDWIDGENGIQAITKIDVTDGLTMDALNLGQKLYNVMNRIAISGGTYEDWLEAVWGQEIARRNETPIYVGGMSAEIVFQEVVGTAETETDGEINPIGTLAGKGTQISKKGGKIEFQIKDDPCIIMAISSITPRINYYQGNDWYITELKSLDDLHKPELDGIGFQDLITEQMAYFDVKQEIGGNEYRNSAGKQPAWINYMTDYDRVFGDFCDNEKAGYMVLKRDYEFNKEQPNPSLGTSIKDLTTYIDPTKYNYAFADNTLKAQNFWVQLYFDIKARRKMSARLIPNL